jgi:hypothetical protein
VGKVNVRSVRYVAFAINSSMTAKLDLWPDGAPTPASIEIKLKDQSKQNDVSRIAKDNSGPAFEADIKTEAFPLVTLYSRS